MKNTFIGCSLAALTLSACGGGETTTRFSFEQTNLSGSSYSGSGARAEEAVLSVSSDMSTSAATITFDPSSSGGSGVGAYSGVTLVTDGGSTFFSPTTGNQATSFTGETLIFSTGFTSGPDLEDVLLVLHSDPSFSFMDEAGAYVMGNRTPSASQPNGSVTYTGKVIALSSLNQTDSGLGDMSVEMDFTNRNVNNGSLVFDEQALTGTTMVFTGPMQSDGSFTTILGSSDTTISDSMIEGRLFGADGGELAGTFYVDSTAGEFVGLFGATD